MLQLFDPSLEDILVAGKFPLGGTKAPVQNETKASHLVPSSPTIERVANKPIGFSLF